MTIIRFITKLTFQLRSDITRMRPFIFDDGNTNLKEDILQHLNLKEDELKHEFHEIMKGIENSSKKSI